MELEDIGHYSAVGIDEDDNTILIFESVEQERHFLEAFAARVGATYDNKRYQLVFSDQERAQPLLRLFPDAPVDEDDEVLREDRVYTILGVESGFSDQYVACCECGRYIDTNPQSYCDGGRFRYTDDGDLVCLQCDQEDPEQYYEDYRERIANGVPDSLNIDPEQFDLIALHDDDGAPICFQHGFHAGMNDDPKRQLSTLHTVFGTDFEVAFKVSPSQFYVEWNIFVGPRYHDIVTRLLVDRDPLYEWDGIFFIGPFRYDPETDTVRNEQCPTAAQSVHYQTKTDIEPATAARHALQSVRLLPCPDGPIQMVSINPDGTSSARIVSNEEFIQGLQPPERT